MSTPDPTVRARRFDTHKGDEIVDANAHSVKALSAHQLLWADVDSSPELIAQAAAVFGFDADLMTRGRLDRPAFSEHQHYFHMALMVPGMEGATAPVRLDCFVAEHWVVTISCERVDYMDRFLCDLKEHARIRHLDGLLLAAAILDDQVTACLGMLEGIEERVDDLDATLLERKPGCEAQATQDLVTLRREVADIRRLMVHHRDVFAKVAEPGFPAFVKMADSIRFTRCADRLERAIVGAEAAREMLVGSFDILMAGSAQQTNNIMQLLTVVSVALLPCAAAAGILGMNFKVGLFDAEIGFWVSLAFMAVSAAGTLIWARRKHWI